MNAVKSLDDVNWQQTCHGRLAEVQTPSGWVRLVEDGTGWTVTRFGTDLMPVGEPAQMTSAQVQAELGR